MGIKFQQRAKRFVELTVVAPLDRFVMPIARRVFSRFLRLKNRRRFPEPRARIDSKTVLIYSPNIGGHRPVYSAKFIDYYRRQGYEVYFVWCGLELDYGQRVYSEFRSRFIDYFKDDEHVHLVCVWEQLTRDTNELDFIVGLQKKYEPFLTVFVDGDILMNTFREQARRGRPRLFGRNFAVFIMIDFPYFEMSLRQLWRETNKRAQIPHLLFHRYYFKYLDLLDGALVSDENLIRQCRPSKHVPLGDVVHFELPSDEHDEKNRFFAKKIDAYREFLAANPGKEIILQFGELEQRKGYDFLLRLVAENPDLVLVRAGRTKPSYRIRWDSILHKETLLLENRLFEVDIFIDSQEFIDTLFNSVNYFLFAYQNHFRTSIMLPLALSYGKPVMVPSVGLMKTRVVTHGVGRVYTAGSYESFAEGFASFREDHESYADNVRAYYQSDFSDEAFDARLQRTLGTNEPAPSSDEGRPVAALDKA